MKKTHFLAIDTETGGLIQGHHALLQLAAVPSWDAEPFVVWIWPDDHAIDPESVAISGYYPDLWSQRGAVNLETALGRFRDWLEKAPVDTWKLAPLAHNAGFDRGFLDAAFAHCGRKSPLSHRWRCSMAAMAFLQDAGVLEPGATSLNALAGLCGMQRSSDKHDALEDARICMAGYHWLMRLPRGQADAAVQAALTHKLN